MLSEPLNTLLALEQRYGRRVIVSTYPGTRKRLFDFWDSRIAELSERPIELLSASGFFDYVKLQTTAFCVLSDSGTLTEEATLLGFPAAIIREAHEAPAGTDAGVLTFAGVRQDRVSRRST